MSGRSHAWIWTNNGQPPSVSGQGYTPASGGYYPPPNPLGSAPDWRTNHAQPFFTPIAPTDPYSPPITTAFQDAPRHTTLTGTNILFDQDLFGRPPEKGGAKLIGTFVGPRGRLIAEYLDPRNNTIFYTGGPVQRYG